MFLENKYTRTYYNIVSKAKNRVNCAGYFEKHHIVPKCLGGSNTNDNLVELTGREHFVCHLLLTKMTEGNARKKMLYAFILMSNRNIRRDGRSREFKNLGSRAFQKTRSDFRKAISESRAGRSIFSKTPEQTRQKKSFALAGRVFSEETKKLMSESAKKRSKEIPSWNTGKKLSEEQKINFKKPKSTEHRLKLQVPKRRICCIVCRREMSVNGLLGHHKH